MAAETNLRMRALIVDDEPLAVEGVRRHLSRHTDVEIVGSAGNAREAVEAVRELRPDVVFLDVQMPGLGGFGLVEALGGGELPIIVFVTAHDSHAVRAFDVRATDYVLKPIERERFDSALDRARTQLRKVQAIEVVQRLRSALGEGRGARVSQAPAPSDPSMRADERAPATRFFAKSGKRTRVVSADELDWIQAEGDHVRLHAADRSYLIRTTLGDMEARLDPRQFVRIHRSTIVNVDRIREIQPYSNREYVLVLEDGTKLKLSRSYRDRFDARFGSPS